MFEGSSAILHWFGSFVPPAVALCVAGCGNGMARDDASDTAESVATATSAARESLYAPPQPLTAAVAERVWTNMFGGYARASQLEPTDGERESLLAALEESGIPRQDVVFVGANVLVQDVAYDATPLLDRWRAETAGATLEKGKVLAQVITQVIGLHDTTLVQPREVVGAPTQYASQPINDTFLFDRPEVDPSFEHVLVLTDGVPEEIFAAFRASIAEIGNASSADCLGENFLEVLSRSEFDARFANRPFELPPRVTEAVYAPEICGPRSLGCTQFPHAEEVVVTAPTPDGEEGTFQSRVLVGGFIGINSTQITPQSAEFSTITHELLHALGIAHPVVETFPSGAVAAKLVVPGSASGDGGYPSIMAFRNTENRTFNLSVDDVDTIETLYASAPGCQYQTEPIRIEADVDTVADPPPAGPIDAGTADSD